MFTIIQRLKIQYNNILFNVIKTFFVFLCKIINLIEILYPTIIKISYNFVKTKHKYLLKTNIQNVLYLFPKTTFFTVTLIFFQNKYLK